MMMIIIIIIIIIIYYSATKQSMSTEFSRLHLFNNIPHLNKTPTTTSTCPNYANKSDLTWAKQITLPTTP